MAADWDKAHARVVDALEALGDLLMMLLLLLLLLL